MRYATWLSVMTVTLAVLTTGCTHSDQQTFTFESEVAPTGLLSVETFGGAVLLTRDPAASKVHGTVTVRASGFDTVTAARQAATDLAVVESGDAARLELSVRIPAGLRRSNFDVSFDLFVPSDVTVSAQTTDGPILVDGLPATNLTTNNAQVELRMTRGAPIVRTSDGPIIVDAHDGPLDLRTHNAPIDLSSVAGDVRASTTNGFITCRALPPRGAELILATSDAGIDLSLPYDWEPQVVATTTVDNQIFVQDLDFYPTYEAPGQLEGDIRSGLDGLVDLRTTYSDIVVRSRR